MKTFFKILGIILLIIIAVIGFTLYQNMRADKLTPGAEELNGISIFEIGDTWEDIEKKASGLEKYAYFSAIEPKIDYRKPLFSEVRLSNFELNNEIPIDRLILYFFRGTLYKILMSDWHSDTSYYYDKMLILRNNFIEKYGKGVYAAGGTYIRWNNGSGVKATYMDGPTNYPASSQDIRSLTIESSDKELELEMSNYELELQKSQH